MADSPRLLVVDDDPRFGMALSALLERAGMVVLERAENGAHALELVAQLGPDLVTMDIDMPVMDGLEATKQLLDRYPGLPIVLVTGSESSERVDEARAAGAVAFVPKADAAEALVPAIREVLARGRAAREAID